MLKHHQYYVLATIKALVLNSQKAQKKCKITEHYFKSIFHFFNTQFIQTIFLFHRDNEVTNEFESFI